MARARTHKTSIFNCHSFWTRLTLFDVLCEYWHCDGARRFVCFAPQGWWRWRWLKQFVVSVADSPFLISSSSSLVLPLPVSNAIESFQIKIIDFTWMFRSRFFLVRVAPSLSSRLFCCCFRLRCPPTLFYAFIIILCIHPSIHPASSIQFIRIHIVDRFHFPSSSYVEYSLDLCTTAHQWWRQRRW